MLTQFIPREMGAVGGLVWAVRGRSQARIASITTPPVDAAIDGLCTRNPATEVKWVQSMEGSLELGRRYTPRPVGALGESR